MAYVTVRVRMNTDHSVLINRNQFDRMPDNFMASCCCGWRGNVWSGREAAQDEARWHVDNHVFDRCVVSINRRTLL